MDTRRPCAEAVLRRKTVVWVNQGILVEEKSGGGGGGGDGGEASAATAGETSFYRLTSGEDSKAAFGAAAADDEGVGGRARLLFTPQNSRAFNPSVSSFDTSKNTRIFITSC